MILTDISLTEGDFGYFAIGRDIYENTIGFYYTPDGGVGTTYVRGAGGDGGHGYGYKIGYSYMPQVDIPPPRYEMETHEEYKKRTEAEIYDAPLDKRCLACGSPIKFKETPKRGTPRTCTYCGCYIPEIYLKGDI